MSSKAVESLMVEVAELKQQVAGLMRWQKWEMVILAGILIAVISKRV